MTLNIYSVDPERWVVPKELQDRVLHWFAKTILPRSHADGTFEKFLEELEELKEAREHIALMASTGDFTAPEAELAMRTMAVEAADVFISFIAWCYAAGVPLGLAVQHKHAINEGRKWGPPDERGVRRHV